MSDILVISNEETLNYAAAASRKILITEAASSYVVKLDIIPEPDQYELVKV